ncbi:MAG: ATP synthase F1 subunit epsilon [Candidatus Gracilibacteria bacterium]|nr:ATP synthase F1 subunit epsilon [Candidatus Gracilibacteria bacterium]
MKIEILSFTGNLFKSDNVESVTANTKIGEITILDDHTPLVTVLNPTIISIVYTNEAGEKSEKDFAVGGGVLEVSNSAVKILIDMLITVDTLDVDQAEKAKKEALELMEKYKDAKDKIDMEKFIEAEDMLLKSVVQLKLGDLNK